MATTSSGGGVVETVRQQLAAGYSGDAVVEGLIAGGLSRPSAERFVQRAGGQVTATTAAGTPPPMPTALPPPVPTLSTAPLPTSPPPVPAEYQATSFPATPYPATSYPAHAHAGTPAASATGSLNGLKVAGGALLLLIGVGLLALSLSASGRVRLKLPLALVFGGGATLAHALKER